MKRTIKGKKYKFVVNFYRCRNVFCFDIEAINLQNKKYSFINNLNCILSEFNININDERTAESQWKVKENIGKLFFNLAVNFISDNKFRKHLENQLNIDRDCGEWENSVEVIN